MGKDWEDVCTCGHHRDLHIGGRYESPAADRCRAIVGWDSGGFIPRICRCETFAPGQWNGKEYEPRAPR